MRINTPAASLVTGTMPYWGGPTGSSDTSGSASGGSVLTYGNSPASGAASAS